MADPLIRNLKPETLAELREEAARNGRSVQSEVPRIVEDAIERIVHTRSFWERAAELRTLTVGTEQTDSAVLLREDRETDYGRRP